MRYAIFVARWLILGALATASAVAGAQSAKPADANSAASGASQKAKLGKRARAAGKPSASRPADALSRDVVFDGSTVNGRYLSAGEAISTVEQEKKMNDLIGARANFVDRLKADRTRLGNPGYANK